MRLGRMLKRYGCIAIAIVLALGLFAGCSRSQRAEEHADELRTECVDTYLKIYYGGDKAYRDQAIAAVSAQYKERQQQLMSSNYDGNQDEMNERIYEDLKKDLDKVEKNSEEIKEFLGGWKPEMDAETRAKIINPDSIIMNVNLTADNKIQILDPELKLDTSTPAYTSEEVEALKWVWADTKTHTFSYTVDKDSQGKKTLTLKGETGTWTLTLSSANTMSISNSGGTAIYNKV